MTKQRFVGAAQFYVQLHQGNHGIADEGGGVDYDGTRSSYTENSTNYSIQEYVNDAVFYFVDVANKITSLIQHHWVESGRALTAHHSVLFLKYLKPLLSQWDKEREIQEDDHELRKNFMAFGILLPACMLSTWHDAQHIREESLDAIRLLDGKCEHVEELYFSIAREINLLIEASTLRTNFDNTSLRLTSICNFSLFQSLPTLEFTFSR